MQICAKLSTKKKNKKYHLKIYCADGIYSDLDISYE